MYAARAAGVSVVQTLHGTVPPRATFNAPFSESAYFEVRFDRLSTLACVHMCPGFNPSELVICYRAYHTNVFSGDI